MPTTKYILLYTLLLSSWTLLAQEKRIDSLKRVLPDFSNNSRIECLNEISLEYILSENKDSATHYARLAEIEAKTSNFAHGIAVSLVTQSKIVLHFDNDFIKLESLGREALRWFEKTSNKTGIESAYDNLSIAASAQSRFEEAIGYIKQKLNHCNQTKNIPGQWDATVALGMVYKDAGDYEKSLYYYRESYQLALKADNPMLSVPLYGIGDLYARIENHVAALPYYRKAFQIDDRNRRLRLVSGDWEMFSRNWDIWVKMEFAELFSNLNQFDSAWYYYKLFKPRDEDHTHFRVYLVSTGECLLMQNKYKPALQNFLKSLAYNLKLNDRNQVMRIYLDIAKTHDAMRNDTAALRYAQEGLNLALQTRARPFVRDGYKILYSIYDRRHQPDSANLYFRKYTAMKDSVANDQIKAKFAAYNYDQKIELLDKEKQLKQQQLNQTTQQKKFLIAGITALCLIGIILFRNLILKRKNEKLRLEHELELQQLENAKTQATLQQKAIELEMQALRAQMNPHFIFNSLNSISVFIMENNKAEATEYLRKFSRLVRLILQNSISPLITLESELEALGLYLELEALRFNHHFAYEIDVAADLNLSIVKVPPLIIQPYVENAIWHGLMQKEEKGNLQIKLFRHENALCCKIVDDGIGRKNAADLKNKSASTHKSLGMRITADRIEMLEHNNQVHASIKINDIVLPDGTAGGTEVLLKIPLLYD